MGNQSSNNIPTQPDRQRDAAEFGSDGDGDDNIPTQPDRQRDAAEFGSGGDGDDNIPTQPDLKRDGAKRGSDGDVPWRTFRFSEDEYWSTDHRDELLDAIPEIKFSPEKCVTKGKIVLFGPVSHGKSSFINSIISIEKDRLAQKAPDGACEGSMTQRYHQFICNNLLVADTMGIEIRDGLGINIQDIMYVLKGNINQNYKFDPANPITPRSPGFNPTPSNADRVHCVIICLKATELESIQPEHKRKIKALQDAIQELRIPRIMILTNIDNLCANVQEDVKNTFKSFKVKKAVSLASEKFFIPKMYIHPVQNFTSETYPEHKLSILLLTALKQALEFAQDFVEEIDPREKNYKTE